MRESLKNNNQVCLLTKYIKKRTLGAIGTPVLYIGRVMPKG